MTEGREEVALEAEVVCSVRMVVLWAMHALWVLLVEALGRYNSKDRASKAEGEDVLEQRRCCG